MPVPAYNVVAAVIIAADQPALKISKPDYIFWILRIGIDYQPTSRNMLGSKGQVRRNPAALLETIAHRIKLTPIRRIVQDQITEQRRLRENRPICTLRIKLDIAWSNDIRLGRSDKFLRFGP